MNPAQGEGGKNYFAAGKEGGEAGSMAGDRGKGNGVRTIEEKRLERRYKGRGRLTTQNRRENRGESRIAFIRAQGEESEFLSHLC